MQDENDEADGGSSLTASVGMQVEPATYCPPSTSMQVRHSVSCTSHRLSRS